jgi:hypothetical protein
MVMTLIGETNTGDPAQEDLMEWATDYGLTHPVLADPGFSEIVNYLYADPSFNGSFGLPNMELLSPGMVVVSSNGWVNAGDIEALLE